MAVTLTQAELSAALRLGDSSEENAQATRLLAYATEAVTKHLGSAFSSTPDAVSNEAVIRLSGYLYDQPTAAMGDSYANAMRNSGAARMLLPYVVHRAGSTGEAVAAAQSAMGSADNPVTGISITGTVLAVTFADGSSVNETLPSGGGGDGTDQTARDAATAARTAADSAQSTADSNTAALGAKLERSDVNAGVGIAITPTAGSDTEFTISATGSSSGPENLSGSWTWVLLTPIMGGRVYYAGAVSVGEIDTWQFNVLGNSAAAAQLLALSATDTILISESNTRHQTITVTATPTQSGNVVTVSGRADRGLSSQIPNGNASVTITLTPGPIEGVDQTARDAAAAAQSAADTAQSSVDSHAASAHNTDQTARDDLAAHIAAHPAGNQASWHWFATISIAATTAANTAVNGTYRSGPFGPYANAAAVRTAITSNAIAQLIVYVEEIDVNAADADRFREVIPTVTGFGENAGSVNVFESRIVGENPKKFTINLSGATPTATLDFAFTVTNMEAFNIRVGVWA